MAESFGHGTTLHYSTDGGSTYTLIAEVISIDAVKSKRKKISKTTLASANEHHQFRAGLKETDAVKVKLQYNKTIFAATYTLFNAASASAAIKWKITLEDGSTSIGTGFIEEHDAVPKIDSEDILVYEFSVMPDSYWPFTAGS